MGEKPGRGNGVRLLLGAGAVLAGAACAAPTPDPGDGSSVTPTPAGTELTIVVRDATGAKTSWRLTCDPAGGDHPDPSAACAALTAHGERALPPVAKDLACTQVYGGPETASITGTWQGRRVVSAFSRTNGCEIARWRAMTGLLPTAGS